MAVRKRKNQQSFVNQKKILPLHPETQNTEYLKTVRSHGKEK